MTKKFQRRMEDFTCEHCGFFVQGNGYTNHCPKCLWCKHVDKNPGDREEECQGMMRPIGWEMKKGEYVVMQKCVKCGFLRKNKLSLEDNVDVLIQMRQKPV